MELDWSLFGRGISGVEMGGARVEILEVHCINDLNQLLTRADLFNSYCHSPTFGQIFSVGHLCMIGSAD